MSRREPIKVDGDTGKIGVVLPESLGHGLLLRPGVTGLPKGSEVQEHEHCDHPKSQGR